MAERMASENLAGVRSVRLASEYRVLGALLAQTAASKADLARITGLSKSTVSGVVDGLERSGVLIQDSLAVGAIGRPSLLYTLHPAVGHVVGIDLGGTKLLAGLSDLRGELLAEIELPTCRGPAAELIDQITGVVERLAREADLDAASLRALAIGIPGIYDPNGDAITDAFNLPALGEVRFGATLRDLLGIPVEIANDVNLAALGEQARGHARSLDSFVTLAIGTGVGMGIVIDGQLVSGRRGAAGEVGHLPIVVADPFDARHRAAGGPLEAVASGPAIAARAREIRAASPTSSLPEEPTTFDVFRAAADGDAAARAVVDEEARAIALAIASVGAVLDPELVVLAGGIGAQPVLLEPVRMYLAGLLPDPPEVAPSELGTEASLWGAIEAALRIARDELLLGAGKEPAPWEAARRVAGSEGGNR